MSVSLRRGESPTACTVNVNGVNLVFSYETIVAFGLPGFGWCASENVWSKTTGKHLNQETPVPRHMRTDHEEFEARLGVLLANLGDPELAALLLTQRVEEQKADLVVG